MSEVMGLRRRKGGRKEGGRRRGEKKAVRRVPKRLATPQPPQEGKRNWVGPRTTDPHKNRVCGVGANKHCLGYGGLPQTLGGKLVNAKTPWV